MWLTGATETGGISGTEGVTFSSTGGEGSFLSTTVVSSLTGAGTGAIVGSFAAGGS